MKPAEKAQIEMVVGGISEVLVKVADGKECILALPGPDICFEATGQYGIDGVTEKVNNWIPLTQIPVLDMEKLFFRLKSKIISSICHKTGNWL